MVGSAEATFNEAHSKCRSIIERCIGMLKGRWRILLDERKSRYTPEKVAKLINVCTALHNICVHYKIHFNFEKLVPETATRNNQHHLTLPPNYNPNYTKIGEQNRLMIKNNLTDN